MEYRRLGRTDMIVSRIGFGAWAIGGFWGAADDDDSMRALHAAVDNGVNFIDTADVYGDGRSERLVARLRRERPGETIWVATKAGRKLPEQTVGGYCEANLRKWIDDSLRNLQIDAIDLLQLHCPPRDRATSASSRAYRSRAACSRASSRARRRSPPTITARSTAMAQAALRWILTADAVMCAIPGARTPAQAADNAGAARQHPLPPAFMAAAKSAYEDLISRHVHHRW